VREAYDFIVIDAPPLLAVSDPSVIAPRVDGVLLAIRISKNGRPLAERAREILTTLGARVLGVVVNGEAQGPGLGYGYNAGHYGYGYYGQYGYGDNYHADSGKSYYTEEGDSAESPGHRSAEPGAAAPNRGGAGHAKSARQPHERESLVSRLVRWWQS
jgi:Mrp family chromosome partitioning ATPase